MPVSRNSVKKWNKKKSRYSKNKKVSGNSKKARLVGGRRVKGKRVKGKKSTQRRKSRKQRGGSNNKEDPDTKLITHPNDSIYYIKGTIENLNNKINIWQPTIGNQVEMHVYKITLDKQDTITNDFIERRGDFFKIDEEYNSISVYSKNNITFTTTDNYEFKLKYHQRYTEVGFADINILVLVSYNQ